MGTKPRFAGILAVIAAIMLALVLTACGGDDDDDTSTGGSSDDPIVIGYSAWPGWFPWAVAEEQGFFEEEGVNVELRFFSGLTIEETAELVGLSTPTIERRWRLARAFLRQHMRGDPEATA